MLSVLALIASASLASPPETLPSSAVRGADPLVLAGRVLPPEAAARITGGRIRRAWMPFEAYSIGLWERPVVHAPGLCRRAAYFGGARAPAERTTPPGEDPLLEIQPFAAAAHYAPTWPREASAASCQSVTGWIGAIEADAEPTLRMLTRLTDAMDQAAGRGRLGFALRCTSEVPQACADARRALAALPLDQLLAVRLHNTAYRDDPVRDGVRVRYMQPVVDGRWPEAEVNFDASDPDGRSWTVVLQGIDRLEAVEMRRTTIIRH
jgi:hypothetical protein